MKHGGKREGAGRKKIQGESRRLRLRLSEEKWEQIDNMGLDINDLVAFALEYRDKIQEEEHPKEKEVDKLNRLNAKYLDKIQHWKERYYKAKANLERGKEIQKEIIRDYVDQIKQLQKRLDSKPRGNTRKLALVSHALLDRLDRIQNIDRYDNESLFLKSMIDTLGLDQWRDSIRPGDDRMYKKLQIIPYSSQKDDT